MSAKITLVGHPEDLQISQSIVSFRIVTGPASNTAPKGLPLFKAATYTVQCNERQYNRGRAHADDKSDLIIEGYLEPRLDRNGEPFIAVVATTLNSILAQNEKKLQQLREQFVQAETAYEDACEAHGENSPNANMALEQWEATKASLLKYLEKHPEFKGRELF
ncbi:MAG: hypothetical protein JW892_14615 [Anaerolineae bacterium]|nr:hypothetical protein [Anaerolineae bacterium]